VLYHCLKYYLLMEDFEYVYNFYFPSKINKLKMVNIPEKQESFYLTIQNKTMRKVPGKSQDLFLGIKFKDELIIGITFLDKSI
jgi:hypothetical protein